MWKCVFLLSHMFTNCWLVSVLWQLAFEIDREADDQNDYLDNMVRNGRFRHLSVSHCLLITDSLLLGLQLHECDRSAVRQREAFFHHGAVWEGQPPYSVLRVHGAGPGLLPALLPDLQDTAVTSDFYFVKRRGSGERKLHKEPTGRTNLLWLAADTWTYRSQQNFCLYHIVTQALLKRLLRRW